MALWRAVVNLTYPVGSKHGTNTWHLRSTGIEPADTDVQDLLDAIEAFYTAIAGSFCTDMHFAYDGFVTQVGVTDPDSVGGYDTWSVAGTNGTTYSPTPVMACITWRSTKASRRGRGRTFLGPLAFGETQGDGTLSGGLLDRLNPAAADLIDASMANSNGAIGVYSQVDGLLRDYVAHTITDQAAVLRSRRG